MNQPEYGNTSLENDISEEGMRERRYLWMARTFALVAVVAFLSMMMLLSALLSLLPIVRVQPFYLTTLNKNQQVINVVPPNVKQLDMQLLTESFIRQYILAYFTVGSNIAELERRWGIDGIINWMSSPIVFEEFIKYSQATLKQARNDGLTRHVRILNAVLFRAEPDGNVWRAEVELTDMKYGEDEPVKIKILVTMKVAFQPTRKGLTWEQRLKNPLGFTVMRFGRQKKD